MLAAISAEDGGDDGVHRRASPEFVAALFDDFASTFDEKLGALEYRVPGIIGATAAQARGDGTAFVSALDAGAGTGLAGRFLRPIVTGPMVGVDISQKMLDKAATCTLTKGCGIDEETEERATDGEDAKLYDGLVASDLEAMTLEETLLAPGVTRSENLSNEDKQGFDLVVAADVLVYFGRLESVLGNFANLSKPGSSLMFTCERATEEEAPLGYRLLTSGRFSHTKGYVLDVAKDLGYSLASYEEIVPRMEKGKEVKGHIFHFILEGGDGSAKEEL
jgi:predicted TPR repeat methyltransferase